MQLPAPLEPWQPWLTLLAPDLVEPTGSLLLRLQPLLGRPHKATIRPDDQPEGVGNIVRRGQYEHLLMTEWLYADAEPDEFIRRAAGGELLFTGPEAAGQQCSRLCVALFDAGPAQLGAPRLAHLALFILLARRAQAAGAEFKWGILQRPGTLHGDTGKRGLQLLLAARTLAAPSGADAAAWQQALAALDPQLRDCWLLGGTGAAAPKQVAATVTVAVELLAHRLRVLVRERAAAAREIALDLPADALAVRMLRDPFTSIVPAGRLRQISGRASIKQPPRFSSSAGWLAVPQLDQGALVLQIPAKAGAAPGKQRVQHPPPSGSILAATVLRKNLSYILAEAEQLVFCAFPGRAFTHEKISCARPPIAQFRAPPGMARWLPTFFLAPQRGGDGCERVLVLDTERQLVCWEMKYSASGARLRSGKAPTFRCIAEDVVGAVQIDHTLIFATSTNGATQLYRWHSELERPAKLDLVRGAARAVLFGNGVNWKNGLPKGLLALQASGTEWLVGEAWKLGTVDVADGATVAGVATLKQNHGLVVLHPNKRSIQFRSENERVTLVDSAQPIAQLAVDPRSGQLAWHCNVSYDLTVRELDATANLLELSGTGGANDS